MHTIGSRPGRLPHKRKAGRSPTLKSESFHGTLPKKVDAGAFVDVKSTRARRRCLRWRSRRAQSSRVGDIAAQLASNLRDGRGQRCYMPVRQARARLVRGRIACSPFGSFAVPALNLLQRVTAARAENQFKVFELSIGNHRGCGV